MRRPRTQYLYDLSEIQRALLQLSEAVQQAISQTLRALRHNDVSPARRIIRADDNIDERRANVEERVLHVIATQQPLATDLRFCWLQSGSPTTLSGWAIMPKVSRRWWCEMLTSHWFTFPSN